jgi:hypothetical protein
LVIEIRRRYIRRHKIHGATAMAREFGLRYPTIFSIIKGETWAHIKNTTPTG